jgi:hypothetical protein
MFALGIASSESLGLTVGYKKISKFLYFAFLTFETEYLNLSKNCCIEYF